MPHFTNRQLEIIRFLQIKDIKTANEIAAYLHNSTKTIRNEINVINKINPDSIISIKSQGYRLNKDNKTLQSVIDKSVDSDENKIFLLLKIFMSEKACSIYDICEQLFISESNLIRMIEDINKMFKQRRNNVCLKRIDNQIVLCGEESDNRKALAYVLLNGRKQKELNISNYKNYFQAFDVDEIYNYTIDFIDSQKLEIRGIEIFSLVLHVCIMIERIQQGNAIINPDFIDVSSSTKKIVEEYYKGLKNILNIELSNKEIKYLCILFEGRLPIINEDKVIETRLLVRKIFSKLYNTYNIDLFEDKKLEDCLIVHILGLANRIGNKTFLKNPMIDDIKKSFPFLFDASVCIAEELGKYFGVKLFEDEIGYITFHLMGAAERDHVANTKRVVIISSLGKSGQDYFQNKIRIINEYNVEVLRVLDHYQFDVVKQLSPDLIISFDNYRINGFKTFYSKQMLSESELKEIYKLLKDNSRQKELTSLFVPDLFFKDVCVNNKEEIIHLLSDALMRKGIVDADFERLVLKRDAIAPLSYGSNFAIPHAIEKVANKDVVAVAILKNPILWCDFKVKIIFMLCPAKSGSNNFELLYERFVALLNNKDLVNRLLDIKDYAEFIDVFVNGN